MGRQWVSWIGLGQYYEPSNPFHVYCRSCDVEGRVKAGVANGFRLEEELRAAFEKHRQQKTDDSEEMQQPKSKKRKGGKGGKQETSSAPASAPSSKSAISTTGIVTRSGTKRGR